MSNNEISEAMASVSNAARAFEGRWTMRALRRVDNNLYEAMEDQLSRYRAALVTGTVGQVQQQAGGCIRGYQACVKAMEAAQEPDDAYMLGVDYRTGVTVAIGDQRACADRVRMMPREDGKTQTVTWLTPDEVAVLFASVEGFKAIDAIKAAFPGAEIVDQRASTQ